ncbi:hypothetical protein GCM10025876_02400 [Demequina litorisediminis]|uniref:2-oxoacid dehydrogenase acyltransferase catalytic domain-containing protein n=1 Tax=Demequina litorisediminis TaxID=1849022 RepID=A0ABQ6I9V8_9MICO|nr:hypothetical protein GCM10025876_02400 [Demequina litorisediminis]
MNLTFLPFFTRAVAIALQEHAFLNASVDGDSIVYHPTVNLSLAVDTEKGLMLPTLRDADSKTIVDHAKGIVDLATKARDGGLKSDEISGGTFSVTNTGSGGTLFDTPIVPSPQVGILATCAIVKKPVVVKGPDGEDVISVRPMCYLPLAYDHRIVDGADAARFLQTVKRIIEAGEFESEPRPVSTHAPRHRWLVRPHRHCFAAVVEVGRPRCRLAGPPRGARTTGVCLGSPGRHR